MRRVSRCARNPVAEVVANCDHLAKLRFSKSLACAFSEHGAIKADDLQALPKRRLRFVTDADAQRKGCRREWLTLP